MPAVRNGASHAVPQRLDNRAGGELEVEVPEGSRPGEEFEVMVGV